VVLDEYGGMVGIVTINDLLEELVGDLGEVTPEEQAAEPHIEQIDAMTWALIGNVELAEIEKAIGIDIGMEEVDTFTGLIFNELGMVPADGDHDTELTFKGLWIQIKRIENHQIEAAIIKKTDAM